MRLILAITLILAAPMAWAQSIALTNLNTVNPITGTKTFGPDKLCIAGATSGSICFETSAVAGSTPFNVGTGGNVGSAAFTSASAYEVPLTFSTGLTRTVNTITANAVDLSATGSGGATGILAAGRFPVLTGDLSTPSGSLTTTLATVNSTVGTFGSATRCATATANGKGLITAISDAVCTPAVGSITGMGTGVNAALQVNIGSAGAPVLFNGAGGTPSSIVLTNATGTAASLTAGTVTTNANLTGVITSSGNATSIASQTGTGSKFVVDTSPTIATPVITQIVPGADFSLSQNSVTPLVSVNSGAVANTLHLSGGDIGIGTTASGIHQVLMSGSHGTTATNSFGLTMTTTISPAVGGLGAGINLVPTINKAASGTHAVFATAYLQPPTIGAGSATLTEASTLYISGAPSVGSSTYALHVAAGNALFSGNLIVAQASPASSAACTAGTIVADAGFIYVCASSGVYKRVAVSGGY